MPCREAVHSLEDFNGTQKVQTHNSLSFMMRQDSKLAVMNDEVPPPPPLPPFSSDTQSQLVVIYDEV